MRIHILVGLILLILAGTTGRAQSASEPRPRIHRVDPAEPIVGQSFDIYGDNFGAEQRRWVLYLYQPTRSRESLTRQLDILDWTNRRIRARLPNSIPGSSGLPTGSHYALHIVVPGRLLQSNHFPLTVARAAEPPNISRAGQPWIGRIYTDTSRAELWIYGHGFGVFGRRWNDRGVPEGVEVLINGPGLASSQSTQISSWHDGRVIVWPLTRACDPGTYRVQIRTGPDQIQLSNEMPVTLGPAFCRQPSRPQDRGFMHIDAVEFEINPPFSAYENRDRVLPAQGDLLDIFGKFFDNMETTRYGTFHVGQENRVVELVRVVRGHAQATEIPVFDVRGRPERKIGLQSSDDHICIKIPLDLEPDDYLLRIWDKSASRSSNTVTVRITARVAATRRR